MTKSIEVYIRPSGDCVLLNFYVPKAMRAKLVDGMRRGAFAPDVPMNLEFTVLPQWLTADEAGRANAQESEAPHVRVALSSINFHYED